MADLTKVEQREVKAGRAAVLKCAHCGKESYFGLMNLISVSIGQKKPTCSYECNRALGQVK